MDKKPSRRKLNRKLREKSEADGAFQEGDYDEPEDTGYEPNPEGE